MSTETGGPAFPTAGVVTIDGVIYAGMDLRDYFAAKAMQEFIGHALSGTSFGVSHEELNLGYAKAAYALADAMLKARAE